MKRPQEIEKDVITMGLMVNLTSVFESLASMRIGQIKSMVATSEEFFNELWNIYRQLRVDEMFRYGRDEFERAAINKELYIVITAEGGFSGDIDQRTVRLMLKNYDKDKHDIIIVGHHGAIQLAQQNVAFKRYFKLPSKDQNINVAPIVREVQQYKSTTVFYQAYISLTVQEAKQLNLSKAVEERGRDITDIQEIISEDTYIFEPSTFEVVDHLERSMMGIVLGQVILESKLAQYAARFRAMSAAHQRADESLGDFKLAYNRAKRGVKDERLKEIINGLKHTRMTTE